MAVLIGARLRRHPKLFIALGTLVLLLVGFRLYLPVLVTRFVNQKLNEIPGYVGHIDGVRIHLWRGAYTIDGPELLKESGAIKRPFIEAKDIDLSVDWRALFRGTLVAKVELDVLRVNIVAGPTKATQQKGIDLSAIQKLRDLTPLKIERLIINDGELHYGDPWGKPPFDIYLDDLQVVARNLTNSEKISKSLIATLAIRGEAMHSGKLKVDATIDPYAEKPTFEMQLSLRQLKLSELNPFFKDSLAVKMEDGTLGVFAEVDAKEGKLKGYVKPLIENLNVMHIKDEANVVDTLKGFAVEFAAAIFTNRPHHQFGAKVDFTGSLDKPELSIWDTIISVLGNAFIKALEPKLEGDVAPAADAAKVQGDDKDSKKLAESAKKTKEAAVDKKKDADKKAN